MRCLFGFDFSYFDVDVFDTGFKDCHGEFPKPRRYFGITIDSEVLREYYHLSPLRPHEIRTYSFMSFVRDGERSYFSVNT